MLVDRALAALARHGPLAAEMPGWEPRPGQLAMAERVARALDDDERLLCEAGTGTGKTLAYLVPAILSGRKVLVSTGTKTLQDQIARIDLPRLQAALPERFSFAVMKGLGNYVCLRRFAERTRQIGLAGPSTPDDELLARVRGWLDQTSTGDKAHLDDVPDDAPLWREITSSPETRLGSTCAYFERCHVTSMRRQAVDAQVVLTNHHLFFADLALRSRWPEAQVLPPYEVIIFDEAHQLEDVATEFFGLHVSSQRMFALARDVGRAPLPLLMLERSQSLMRRLAGASQALAEALRARVPAPRDGADESRVPMPDDLFTTTVIDGPLARYHALDTVLEETAALMDRMSEDASGGTSLDAVRAPPPDVAAVLGGLSRRASALRDELGELVDHTRRDRVRWLSASVRNVSLRASPIDVAPTLARGFDAHSGPVIFASATLSINNSFAFVRERLGLGDAAAEASFASPFCWAEQTLVYLPVDLPDPNDDRFALAAAERALELCRLSRGRALLLFTSFRNLRVAEQRFRADGGFPLLVQGQRPRHALLQALRAQMGSVLLASQSFWEGVDVPGEALSLVTIDRIPFAVPDDPLVAARIARMREAGADPFVSYQLPQAALSLRQGFGRLIRTTRDRGVVGLLDGRLRRKPYGAQLLASLPRECRRTEEIADVAGYFGATT